MKKVRNLTVCILAALICVGVSITAFAEERGGIVPSYIGISRMSPRLEISTDRKAMCSDNVIIKSGYTANVTWSLQKQSQKTWVLETTWNSTGKGEISLQKFYYITHGYNYRLVTTVSVYNSVGKQVETAIGTSKEIYF